MKRFLVSALITMLVSVFGFALELPANKIVDASWLQKNINNPKLVLIMGDYHANFRKGHIPNSISWGVGRDYKAKTVDGLPIDLPTPLKFKSLAKKAGINDDSVVIFYGSGESFKTEAKALEAMVIAEYYGVKNTAVLNGGVAAWKKVGGEVTKKPTKPKKGSFKGAVQAGVIATLSDVDGYVANKNASFVDARPLKHFTGVDTDKRLGAHGAIPGATSVQTANIYETKDGATYFKSKDVIKALFKDVDTSKTVVSYCNTGHLASGPWFAAKYILGAKDVRNFKGSMVVYSNAKPARELVKGK